MEQQQVLIAGGFTNFRPLTPADRALFDKVMSSIISVTYEPTEVASQVVAGTNYKFRAIATIPNYDTYHVVVTIFEPLPGQGDPVLVSIVRV
jgi:hypothetical protein